MEYIKGEDLADRLARSGGALARTRRLLALARQVLDALIYLHSQYATSHPPRHQAANIIVTPDGQASLSTLGWSSCRFPSTPARRPVCTGSWHAGPMPLSSSRRARSTPRALRI